MKMKIMLAMLIATVSLQTGRAEDGEVVEAPKIEAAATSQGHWSVSGTVLRPGQDDDWDSATGATLKYTKWNKPGRGLAFSVGVQNWSVNEEIYSSGRSYAGGFATGYAGGLAGDAQIIPFTITGVYQYELSPTVSFDFEAGLSYAIVNSDVVYREALAVVRNGQLLGVETYESDVDIENNLLAVFAADLRYQNKPTDKITWFIGAGAQIDVSKGDFSYPETPYSYALTYENELKAIFVRAGISSSF